MSIIEILIVIAVAGVVVWLITTYVPMDAKFQKLIQVVAIIAVALWLLVQVGLIGSGRPHVPPLW